MKKICKKGLHQFEGRRCLECAKAYNHAYYRTHKEKIQAYTATHKKEKKAYNIVYAIAHPEKQKEYRKKLRSVILNHYGGKCICCGETQKEFLAVDHISGNGAKHRKEIGSSNIYWWIKKNNFPPGFQILCHNCNLAKGFYGSCPHKIT